LTVPRNLISYRREDSAAYAGRLADRLRDRFGRDNVFVDIDTIRPGEDFVEAIDKSLSSCTVLVALIGRGWLDAEDAAGRRRLDESDDFVRTEIAKAFERHVRVIPALVGDAVMPEAKDLPQDLQALTRRQAIEISDSRFHQDVDRLIEALSDTPSGGTNQVTSKRVASSEATVKIAPPWSWVLGTIVVVLIAVAGYWRLTTETGTSETGAGSRAQRANATSTDSREASVARPNAEIPPSGGTPEPTVRDTSGTPPGRAATTVSGPILKSDTGEPVKEIEPNDDILHPNVLGLGTTVRAEIRPVTDKDFFRIRTPAGARNEVRVVVRNRSKLMPQVEIWDSKFNSVTSKYDVSGDLYLNFDAEPSADYFVECRFLTVNRNFADPQDSGGYDLTVLSETAPGRLATTVSSPILKSNNGGPIKELEPNDDILHPNVLVLGTTVRAEIRPVTDKDFFRIRTLAGARNEVRVVIRNRSKLMPQVEIWDAKFSSVTSKYSVSGDLYLNFDAEPSADYFVECRFLTVNRNYADPRDSGGYDLTVLSVTK
jgi:hypothetical protein